MIAEFTAAVVAMDLKSLAERIAYVDAETTPRRPHCRAAGRASGGARGVTAGGSWW
jgi:hypothetical protein